MSTKKLTKKPIVKKTVIKKTVSKKIPQTELEVKDTVVDTVKDTVVVKEVKDTVVVKEVKDTVVAKEDAFGEIITVIPIDKVHLPTIADRETDLESIEFRNLTSSIQNDGLKELIVVDCNLLVLSGKHRQKALERLAVAKLYPHKTRYRVLQNVDTLDMSEAEVKALMYSYNKRAKATKAESEDKVMLLAWYAEEGFSNKQISELLTMSEKTISDLLQIDLKDDEIKELYEGKDIGTKAMAELSKVKKSDGKLDDTLIEKAKESKKALDAEIAKRKADKKLKALREAVSELENAKVPPSFNKERFDTVYGEFDKMLEKDPDNDWLVQIIEKFKFILMLDEGTYKTREESRLSELKIEQEKLNKIKK